MVLRDRSAYGHESGRVGRGDRLPLRLVAEADSLVDAAGAVLGEHHGISAPDALEVLARVAEDQDRQVLDVARDVVLIGLPAVQIPITLRAHAAAGPAGSPSPWDVGTGTGGLPGAGDGDQTPGEALLELLSVAESPEQFLTAVADLAVRSVEGCAWASVTVVRDGSPPGTAASDARAHLISKAQYVHGEGPCVSATGSRQPVRLDDLMASPPGPAWLEAARVAGVTAVVALPLTATADDVAAVLALYATGPRSWSADALRTAEQLASATGRALAVAYRLAGTPARHATVEPGAPDPLTVVCE